MEENFCNYIASWQLNKIKMFACGHLSILGVFGITVIKNKHSK